MRVTAGHSSIRRESNEPNAVRVRVVPVLVLLWLACSGGCDCNGSSDEGPRTDAGVDASPDGGGCEPADLGLDQPYEGSFARAHPDPLAGDDLRATLNGSPTEYLAVQTSFLAHFDEGFETVGGASPIAADGASLRPGKFGNGLAGRVEYETPDELRMAEGTIELWLTLGEPLTSEAFDSDAGQQYLFRHHDDASGGSLSLYVDRDDGALKVAGYSGCGDWAACSFHLTTRQMTLPLNEPVYFAITFSRSLDRTSLYVNGFKLSQSAFDLDLPAASSFTVGHPSVVVDELRILNVALDRFQIRDDYVRGIPLSENEWLFAESVSAGDELALVSGEGDECLEDRKTVERAKVEMTEPLGYVVSRRDELELSFTTDGEMQCAHGTEPDLFEALPQGPGPSSASHSIVVPVDDTLDSFDFYVKCWDGQGDPDDDAFYRRIRVLPRIPTGHPRIANLFWGNRIGDDEVLELARYDLVGVSKSNAAQPRVLRALREHNPDILILIYKTVIGNFNWGPSEWVGDDFDAILRDDLRLMDADGNWMENLYFPREQLYNLYTEVDFSEVMVRHVEFDMLARGDWDGVWYDNAGRHLWFLYDYEHGTYAQTPDFDVDGTNDDLNDPAVERWAQDLWVDGIHELMVLSREAGGPDVLLVGNNATDNPEDFNGKVWEEFLAPDRFDEFLADTGAMSLSFWEGHTQEPRLNWNMFANDYPEYGPQNLRYMRYGLATTLLGGVYFNHAPRDHNRALWWYDEYCVDVATARPVSDPARLDGCRGYLGEPTGPPSEVQPGVWRRDFDRGIVLVNGSAGAATVSLGGPFRHIDATEGGQDPVANPGGTATELELAPVDGRILLRP